MDYSENFITRVQIEKIIELPFSDIYSMLIRYVYFKGLVYWDDKEIKYVDGYFIIEDSSVVTIGRHREDIDNNILFDGYSEAGYQNLENIKGVEFSNNDDLIDEVLSLRSPQKIDVVLYSYIQLCQLMKKLGCPEPKCLTELTKKEYAYDIKLVNQKSNFTLNDAVRIAANIYSIPTGIFTAKVPDSFTLFNHYRELLSDCIKGTNQHGFRLHTVELWCSYNDESGESYSKSYENGIYFKQQVTLDSELTTISKREFVRWCKYENVDTGLYYLPKHVDESIEALEMKLDESEKEVSRLLKIMIDKPDQELSKVDSYPPELQLAIDAFEQLCSNQKKLPTNENIKEWLQKESKERGINHKDGSKELKGLSDIKLKTIPSIIKS
jgi:hypothetical protein